MKRRVVVNPALIAADRRVGALRVQPLQCHRADDVRAPRHRARPAHVVAGGAGGAAAYEVMAGEELAYLKLHQLQRGLREMGLEGAYLRIMGVPLTDDEVN